jgi:AraC-like DNA-binding protein
MNNSNLLKAEKSEIAGAGKDLKLYVRYMLSSRCKTIVKKELRKLEIKHSILSYGAIEFPEEITQKELSTLKRNLRKSGLDLLDVQESKLVDRIIDSINEMIHCFDELPNLKYPELFTKTLLGEANESVLKIFSEVVGMSVIQFIVIQKVEKIKEFLLYDDLPLSEITEKLKYKNEQHLIAQFKKHTGLTPAFFIKLKKERRNIASEVSQHSHYE